MASTLTATKTAPHHEKATEHSSSMKDTTQQAAKAPQTKADPTTSSTSLHKATTIQLIATPNVPTINQMTETMATETMLQTQKDLH